MNMNDHIKTKSPKIPVIWRIIIAVVISAIISGGGVYLWHRSTVKNIIGETPRLQSELQYTHKLWTDLIKFKQRYNIEKEELERTRHELQQQVLELRAKLSKLQWPHIIEEKIPESFFKVYGYNVMADEEVSFYITIPEKLSLCEKMEFIAKILSKCKFHDHPINVLRIENRNNKKIAIIELKEPNFPRAYTWRGGYFQGSSGGHSTTVTLTKSFLQEDYDGEWIDGVEFYYEGKPISSDWDHVFLDGTIFRKRKD